MTAPFLAQWQCQGNRVDFVEGSLARCRRWRWSGAEPWGHTG